MKRYQTLFLEDIYVDDRVKMRANVSPQVVAEYAEAMADSLPRRGYGTKPRVAASAHPRSTMPHRLLSASSVNAPTLFPQPAGWGKSVGGVNRKGIFLVSQVTQGAPKRRPWAVGCNPFGVKRNSDIAIEPSFLPARRIRMRNDRNAEKNREEHLPLCRTSVGLVDWLRAKESKKLHAERKKRANPAQEESQNMQKLGRCKPLENSGLIAFPCKKQ